MLEALRGRRRVRRVWAADDSLAAAARGLGAPEPVKVVPAAELERLCGSPQHQGLVCEAEPYPYADAAQLLASPDALVVALDQVQDPQNLGAVCRSAECAGATGVVIPERRAAEVTPGGLPRIGRGGGAPATWPACATSPTTSRRPSRRGRGCTGRRPERPGAYTDVDWKGRVVIVLGSEGAGIRPRVRAACDELVALPVRGRIGSLNVSAAAAVLLYEAARTRASVDAGTLDKST